MKKIVTTSLFLTVAGAAALLLSTSTARAGLIFDDFNVNEGHFNQSPTYSSTTAGVTTSSTANRIATGGAMEGAGFERLVLNGTTATSTRVRFLSGASTPGSPTGQPTFTTATGVTDGWIGFYYRMAANQAGTWQAGINLDTAVATPLNAVNSSGGMLGSTRLNLVEDGQWHLLEWNLDTSASWAAVGGIGGYSSMNAALSDKSPHTWTIDSIYLYATANVPSGTAIIDLDFVAKSDSGTIANLLPVAVPEPVNVALGIFGGIGLIGVIIRKARKA